MKIDKAQIIYAYSPSLDTGTILWCVWIDGKEYVAASRFSGAGGVFFSSHKTFTKWTYDHHELFMKYLKQAAR